MPLHLHPYYQERFGLGAGDFPVASAEWERMVSLPLYPTMTYAEQDRVRRGNARRRGRSARGARGMKRAFDLVVAALALAVLALPLLAVAALVRLTSPGPALFRQERVGRGGRLFRIWKLRTMVDAAAALGPLVTVGRRRARHAGSAACLRRFKVDELPQLVNVLVGDMSFVGPRPEVPRYVALLLARRSRASSPCARASPIRRRFTFATRRRCSAGSPIASARMWRCCYR